jgi:hypothetical protein
LDGLNSREAKLTALEYCPFHVLANIAQLDLVGKDSLALESLLESAIRPPGRKMRSGSTVKNLFHIGDSGLSVDQIPMIINQAKSLLDDNGIHFGLQSRSGKINGDIVELFGIDFEERTANAVCQLIETLSRYN